MALIVVSLAVPAFPQNRNAGEIRGTITDSSGAAVPDVNVAIMSTATGITTTVTSGGTGVYDAPSLLPGDYSITFSKEGFKRVVRGGITLHVESITVDAVLEVGALSQEVTVQEAIPLVQTETSEKRTTITSQTVLELPNVNRSWYDLTGLLPGVNAGGGQDASGEGIGINGTGSYQANWLIDGGVGTYPVSQNPDFMTVPLEAIAEIDFNLSNFSAEYGNGVAVFNVISKSGTNQWHGSLFEFVQNDKLQARNFFSPRVEPFRWNQFGGSFGGPIRKDKAFFFFSYQRQPTSTPQTGFYTFPTQAMRSGDFSAPGLPVIYDPNSLHQVDGAWVRTPFTGNRIPSTSFDPVSAKIQDYFPTPNRDGIYNNYYFAGSHPLTYTWWTGKLDYNISSGNRLTGSIIHVPMTEDSPAPTCPMDCNVREQYETQGQVTDVWTISPSLVNEFRSSMIRTYGTWYSPNMGEGYPSKLGLNNLQADAFPGISVQGDVPTSISGGLHALIAFTSYVQSDTLTWIHGKHILKFGGEFNKWQQNLAWDDRRAGDFTFSGIFTRNPSDPNSSGLGYADFLFGEPSTWTVYNSPETGGRVWNLQGFAQDDYKLKPNLTINIGLRYILQSGWTEQHNRISLFDPSLTNPATGTPGALWFAGQNGRTAIQKTIPSVFAPRIGFAWSPKPAWSVRGGYGIFDIMWGANTYAGGLGNGWSTQGFLTSTDSMTPIFALSQGAPNPVYASAAARTPDMLNGQSVTYFPYDTPEAYIQQWHLDIQHQLSGGLVVDAGYVGSRGLHLGFGRDLNQVPPQLLGPGDAQSRRPYPQYAGISASFFDGISIYHSFQLSAKKQFSHGFMVLANYTLSKALDTGMGSGWGGAQNIGVWQNAYNPRANYGLSTLDTPQLLNGSFLWEVPVGYGRAVLNRGGVVDAILGGWQLSSTFQLHSGIPFTPVMGTANLSGSLAGNWFPNRLATGTLANPTINLWFDPSAFAQPEPYTFGNSGRDILRGPGFRNMNLSMAKSFRIPPLGERSRLQIRGDFYDAFNHPNFGMPNNNIGTPGVGVIANALTNRNIQLGAKLSF